MLKIKSKIYYIINFFLKQILKLFPITISFSDKRYKSLYTNLLAIEILLIIYVKDDDKFKNL